METDDGRGLRSEVGRMRTEGGEGRDTERCGDPKNWFPMRGKTAILLRVIENE